MRVERQMAAITAVLPEWASRIAPRPDYQWYEVHVHNIHACIVNELGPVAESVRRLCTAVYAYRLTTQPNNVPWSKVEGQNGALRMPTDIERARYTLYSPKFLAYAQQLQRDGVDHTNGAQWARLVAEFTSEQIPIPVLALDIERAAA